MAHKNSTSSDCDGGKENIKDLSNEWSFAKIQKLLINLGTEFQTTHWGRGTNSFCSQYD